MGQGDEGVVSASDVGQSGVGNGASGQRGFALVMALVILMLVSVGHRPAGAYGIRSSAGGPFRTTRYSVTAEAWGTDPSSQDRPRCQQRGTLPLVKDDVPNHDK